jgi:hypothetical protein
MGAVLGIAAFGRTQEKLNGANNGGLQQPAPTAGFSSTSTTPSSFQAPASTGFGAPSTPGGFSSGSFGGVSNTPAPSTGFSGSFGGTAPITTTASGKKIVPTDDPVL